MKNSPAPSLPFTLKLAFALSLSCAWPLLAPPAARASEASVRQPWVSVRSENFLFVGDASAEDMRQAASRLEQFHAALARLLPAGHFDPTIPTIVFVFKGEESYRPFKPLLGGRPEGVAGHFQSGADVNHIAFPLDPRRRDDSLATGLHEYVHLLAKNRFRDAPLWLSEGLAEFYSTLAVSGDGTKVTLGKPVASHAQTMRRGALMPLAALFSVERDSPHYTEREPRRSFYAQSWALAHYLLEGAPAARRAQFARYLEVLSSGATPDESLAQSFGGERAALEGELKVYAGRSRFLERVTTFEKPLTWARPARVMPLGAAEARAFAGDLLLHMERYEEAESHLRQALALDPDSPPALLAIGVLRLRQNRVEEARRHLARAVEADPDNHLARYRHAEALSREGADAHLWVSDYAPERAELMRAELRRAMELAPKFVEPYRLLAFVYLVREERLDEAATLLRQALALAPRRHDLSLLLAQVHLRREEFAEARRLLEALAAPPASGAGASSPQAREHARSLLDSLPRREGVAAARRAGEAASAANAATASLAPTQPCDISPAGPQHKRLRFEGEQRCGQLVRVECDEGGVQLFVAVGAASPLRLRADALSRVRFVTYTTEVKTGALTCGPREPANAVLVTYRPAAAGADSSGEAVAVEFVPADWARRQATPALP